MVEIIFTENFVLLRAEGKLFAKYPRSKGTYKGLKESLTDSSYVDYRVLRHNKEIFRGTSWVETDSFIAEYLEY